MMKMTTMRFRRTAALALAVSAAVTVVPTTFGGASPVSAAPDGGCTTSELDPDQLQSGGEFHALTPARIFDTRDGANSINDTAPIGKKPTRVVETDTSKTFDIQILGQGGVPAADADVLAVVLNVTVAGATSSGFLSVNPKGVTGTSSLVNFKAGTPVPNVAVIGVGTDGKIAVDVTTPAGAGSAHVLVDVFGWISKSAYNDADDSGARLIATSPARILDTRTTGVVGAGVANAIKVPILGADSFDGSITNVVPDSSTVTAVMINLTAVNNQAGRADTFIAAVPEKPTGVPTTSNTNVKPNVNKASLAIVPVGADGSIHLYNNSGQLNLLVDVLGYMQTGAAADTSFGRIIPLDAPFRAFDTRQPEFNRVRLATGSVEEWSFKAFAESVLLADKCVGPQSALIGNVTAANLQRFNASVFTASFLQFYPGDATSQPIGSTVNFDETGAVANSSLLAYGTSDGDDYVLKAYNELGSLHYLLDVLAIVL